MTKSLFEKWPHSRSRRREEADFGRELALVRLPMNGGSCVVGMARCAVRRRVQRRNELAESLVIPDSFRPLLNAGGGHRSAMSLPRGCVRGFIGLMPLHFGAPIFLTSAATHFQTRSKDELRGRP
jgi:hypothetical protein